MNCSDFIYYIKIDLVKNKYEHSIFLICLMKIQILKIRIKKIL